MAGVLVGRKPMKAFPAASSCSICGLSHGVLRFSVVIFYRVTDNVFGNGEQLGTRRFRIS